jgi:hypothetical protein
LIWAIHNSLIYNRRQTRTLDRVGGRLAGHIAWATPILGNPHAAADMFSCKESNGRLIEMQEELCNGGSRGTQPVVHGFMTRQKTHWRRAAKSVH